LAANEKSTRDQAVANLRTYLRSRQTFSEEELLKLWKGLFYCMWMSDKMRNQQQLARDLADLTDVVSKPTFIPFVDAFWKTMAREWNGIGRLRMDKYYYLVRQFLYVSLRRLAKSGWGDEETLDELVATFSDTPLNPRDMKIPNGLRYHMLDIYLDELEKVDDEYEADIPAEKLLKPVMIVLKDCPTKSIRKRAKEELADDRARKWLGLEVDEQQDNREAATKTPEAEDGADGGDWSGFED